MIEKENIIFAETQGSVPNPFQGFYIQLDTAGYNEFSKEIGDNDVNLVLLSYNLSGFTQTKLPQQKLEELERSLVMNALEQSGGIQVKAAELLGISERSIWHRVKKLGIQIKKEIS